MKTSVATLVELSVAGFIEQTIIANERDRTSSDWNYRIGFMELGSSAIRELAQALKENTTLRSLSLSYNKVLNTGCEYLEEALRVNTTLETLYLKVAGISDSGASCLFRALEVNQSLQHLE